MRSVVAVSDSRAVRRVASIHVYPHRALPAATYRNDTRGANEARSTRSGAGFVAVERAHDERIAHRVEIAAHPLAGAACRLEAGEWPEIVQSPARLRGPDVARDALQPARHGDVDERPQRAVDEQQRIALREPRRYDAGHVLPGAVRGWIAEKN